jgi:F5/8 type C domain.
MLFAINCSPEANEPLKANSEVPSQVSNIRVENGAGAAKIIYTLPSDDNILYVEATYTQSGGEASRTKSSVYKNYVEVEGFSRAGEYTVMLRTVSRSEIKSEPVEVKISPSDAVVHTVFPTLRSIATFGGINLRFENLPANEYVLHISLKDPTGVWIDDYDRLYTSATNVSYSVRGLDSTPTDFKFYLTDRWRNSSDTLFATHTPLYEEEFDKSLWKDAALADDFNVPQYGPLSQLWTPGSATYFFISPNMPGLTLPNWFTIDLGREYVFGRLLVHNVSHADSWMYARGTPEEFEIYGSNERTTDWDQWTLLGSFTCVKPSGAPLGTITAEDSAQALAGDNYDFDPSDQSFRYVRFKTLKTFGNQLNTYLLELTFYGKATE